MPPKKAKAATTVQTKGLAKVAPASLGALPADLYDPNVTWHKMISEAIQVIKDCPVFGEDICSAKPLPLTGDADTLTGFQAPFDETVLVNMITQKLHSRSVSEEGAHGSLQLRHQRVVV